MSGLDRSAHVSSLPMRVEAPATAGATWPAGASAPAGLSRHKTTPTDEEVETIYRMRKEGVTWNAIATALGRTKHGVRAIARNRGMGKTRFHWTDYRVRQLIEMKRAQRTNAQIALAIGCGYTTVTDKWARVRARFIEMGKTPPVILWNKPRPIPPQIMHGIRTFVGRGGSIAAAARAFGVTYKTARRATR